MSRQLSIAATAALSLMTGCGFMSNLTSALGADSTAFTTNMSKYEVQTVDLAFSEEVDSWCPGRVGDFKILARAKHKKSGEVVTLETLAPGGDAKTARGKMDLSEFAMAARGGTVDNGTFAADADVFANLLGYDVRATYQGDTTKVSERHFDPEYSCINWVGSVGATGAYGEMGYGADSEGGAGGPGSAGFEGAAGPNLVVYVTVVETPVHGRMGLLKITGDVEQMTLFDATTGVTISARGGDGGQGGEGGPGGQGAAPQGSGGPGGPGGDGANGGHGGQILIVYDHRYPALGTSVLADVSGGAAGAGGFGGLGGEGGPPPEVCSECETPPSGPQGAAGPNGRPGAADGQPGFVEVRVADVSAAFADLPPGVRLRDDPHPVPVAEPTPEPPTTKRRHRRRH